MRAVPRPPTIPVRAASGADQKADAAYVLAHDASCSANPSCPLIFQQTTDGHGQPVIAVDVLAVGGTACSAFGVTYFFHATTFLTSTASVAPMAGVWAGARPGGVAGTGEFGVNYPVTAAPGVRCSDDGDLGVDTYLYKWNGSGMAVADGRSRRHRRCSADLHPGRPSLADRGAQEAGGSTRNDVDDVDAGSRGCRVGRVDDVDSHGLREAERAARARFRPRRHSVVTPTRTGPRRSPRRGVPCAQGEHRLLGRSRAPLRRAAWSARARRRARQPLRHRQLVGLPENVARATWLPAVTRLVARDTWPCATRALPQPGTTTPSRANSTTPAVGAGSTRRAARRERRRRGGAAT